MLEASKLKLLELANSILIPCGLPLTGKWNCMRTAIDRKLKLYPVCHWQESEAVCRLPLTGNWNCILTAIDRKGKLNADCHWQETETVCGLPLTGNWNCILTAADSGGTESSFTWTGEKSVKIVAIKIMIFKVLNLYASHSWGLYSILSTYLTKASVDLFMMIE